MLEADRGLSREITLHIPPSKIIHVLVNCLEIFLVMVYKMVDFTASSVGLQACAVSQHWTFFIKEVTGKPVVKREDKRITVLT